ncbi:FMN-binding negative transcriptional regulator [Pseudomonas sp. P1B16]|nr:FMN-binding negative transcriptional regulator [Pseudomonas sp. P1B16]
MDNPFGTLVTHGPAGLDANHLPFELEPNTGALGLLSAHASKNNPLLNEVKHLDEVLVVFQVGNAYISPTWLPSKKTQRDKYQPGTTWLSMQKGASSLSTMKPKSANWSPS